MTTSSAAIDIPDDVTETIALEASSEVQAMFDKDGLGVFLESCAEHMGFTSGSAEWFDVIQKLATKFWKEMIAAILEDAIPD
jgi:antitoxin component of MazEF toxin-antitoxin module